MLGRAAPFGHAFNASSIDKNPSHHGCCYCVEMRSILPTDYTYYDLEGRAIPSISGTFTITAKRIVVSAPE